MPKSSQSDWPDLPTVASLPDFLRPGQVKPSDQETISSSNIPEFEERSAARSRWPQAFATWGKSGILKLRAYRESTGWVALAGWVSKGILIGIGLCSIGWGWVVLRSGGSSDVSVQAGVEQVDSINDSKTDSKTESKVFASSQKGETSSSQQAEAETSMSEKETDNLLSSNGDEQLIGNTGNPIVREILVVNVSGAVAESGVYVLPVGSRIGDALEKAGGISPQADAQFVQQHVNLAEKLHDEQKIYIPTAAEVAKQQGQVEEQQLLASLISSGAGGESSTTNQTPVSSKISINSASQGELDTLPGIGAARAQAIIEGRPYSQLDELVSTKVISANVYAEIEDLISL